jgi:hypothetical protein
MKCRQVRNTISNPLPMLEQKVHRIQTEFAPLLGAEIVRFQTAELQLLDGSWTPWPDLPLRIFTHAGLIAVSWSRFDDLWIAKDFSLPFEVEDSEVRWIDNAIGATQPLVGSRIHSVLLGRGEMSIEGKDVEIWTRLVIVTNKGWLDVFNALDENGYEFYHAMPSGEFVKCL